jgi:hypothetical protein
MGIFYNPVFFLSVNQTKFTMNFLSRFFQNVLEHQLLAVDWSNKYLILHRSELVAPIKTTTFLPFFTAFINAFTTFAMLCYPIQGNKDGCYFGINCSLP